MPARLFRLLCCRLVVALTIASGTPAAGAQTEPPPSTGALRGTVLDALGGAIVDARVNVRDGKGLNRSVRTDREGSFEIPELAPAGYTVRVEAPGFADYEEAAVVAAGDVRQLSIRLTVAVRLDKVTVEERGIQLLQPLDSATTLVLRGADIASLPDGPGGLEAALRLLAPRSSSPFGPQILVNGFSAGRLPTKNSIREIRINQNPFGAEYDQVGLSRIEILTKPGTDQFHAEAFGNVNDEVLNSRNPFAPERAPFQSRMYGGNFSGPIAPRRASFFVDAERVETDDNAIINATVLDRSFKVVPSNLVLVRPERRTTVAPRIDVRLDKRNTLVARYAESRSKARNGGIGDFTLATRAYTGADAERSVQLTETAVLTPKVGIETRFQYLRQTKDQRGDDSLATLDVPGAFVGGGSDVGELSNRADRWELHNHLSWRIGSHDLKLGGQLRAVELADVSRLNYGGTFTFAGRLAPQLNASDEVVRGPDGKAVMVSITTIESYRRTELFRSRAMPAAEIRELGGGPSQFSISTGSPEARLKQHDAGAFVQDDWRILPNLTLSTGVRYETQNHLRNAMDLAPRIALAWSPDAAKSKPKTVIRAGGGVFFERFRDNLTLRTVRFDGTTQRPLVLSSAAILDLYPRVPSSAVLAGYASRATIVRAADDLRSPYTVHSSVGIERELFAQLALAVTYADTRTRRAFRSRDVNAPRGGIGGARPDPTAGEILEYESTGRSRQSQVLVNLVSRFSSGASLWATYTWSRARSDTDGPETLPASSYDTASEWGRSATDARHTFYWGGWIRSFWGIDWNPLVVYRSGLPFNVTTGRDTNGDSFYLERPALATDLGRASVVRTAFGDFDLEPAAGQPIVARNGAEGPRFFVVNLRASKVLKWAAAPAGGKAGGREYAVVFSAQVQNLLNRVNLGTPLGTLGSPLFGASYSSAGDFGFGSNPAGNRRVELQISVHF